MRAKRRHHLNRMKRKAKSFGDSYMKLYNHLANCSCYMCGNPRKHFKQVTAMEQLANDWKQLQEDWGNTW